MNLSMIPKLQNLLTSACKTFQTPPPSVTRLALQASTWSLPPLHDPHGVFLCISVLQSKPQSSFPISISSLSSSHPNSHQPSCKGPSFFSQMMDLINSVLNLVVPPASLVMLAFAWPALSVINACERVYNNLRIEDMEDKVVIITGASSGIGEQIAYEYAKRRAKIVLVARRENRLRGIGENARQLGAKHVMIMAADVVKLEDCRRFVNETLSYYGRLDHLVNTVSLGHTFYFEEAVDTSVFSPLMDINFWGNVYPTYVALPYLRESHGRVIINASVESWLPSPRMSLYSAAKAALINFYETLRFEEKEIGITIATHGWIGGEMTRGRFMLEDGAEMQWKEEREVHVTGGAVWEFARAMVAGACRGDTYVKYPSWYDIFLLYKVFAPKVLGWTFRLLLPANGARRSTSGRPLLESTSPPKLLTGGPSSSSQHNPHQQHQQKME